MSMTPDAIRDAQRSSWDQASPHWAKWDDVILSMLGPIGDEMVRRLDPPADAVHLDVAAGTGEPGLTIAADGPGRRVVITDLRG